MGSASTTGPIQLRLLDAFDLRRDGASLRLPLGPQRLLAFLALHDRPLLRDYVAGVLWIDYSASRSQANLRSALWRLRQTGSEMVTSTVSHLRLAEDVEVDVRRTRAASRQALGDAAEPPPIDVLSGDLLPDWYDDWVETEREHLRQLRLQALEAVAERFLRRRCYGQAADAGLTAVHAEPLRDSAHRVLIRVHLAQGNESEALRQYELYRWRLDRELGLEPSAQMRELVADLLDRGP